MRAKAEMKRVTQAIGRHLGLKNGMLCVSEEMVLNPLVIQAEMFDGKDAPMRLVPWVEPLLRDAAVSVEVERSLLSALGDGELRCVDNLRESLGAVPREPTLARWGVVFWDVVGGLLQQHALRHPGMLPMARLLGDLTEALGQEYMATGFQSLLLEPQVCLIPSVLPIDLLDPEGLEILVWPKVSLEVWEYGATAQERSAVEILSPRISSMDNRAASAASDHATAQRLRIKPATGLTLAEDAHALVQSLHDVMSIYFCAALLSGAQKQRSRALAAKAPHLATTSPEEHEELVAALLRQSTLNPTRSKK